MGGSAEKLPAAFQKYLTLRSSVEKRAAISSGFGPGGEPADN